MANSSSEVTVCTLPYASKNRTFISANGTGVQSDGQYAYVNSEKRLVVKKSNSGNYLLIGGCYIAT